MSGFWFEDVVEGFELPPFELPLTVQRLVMEAAANRDFAPIHHDRELARASGAPDMYANTMLLQGLFEATIRQWMGLAGRLTKLGFGMRVFNCVGEVVTGRGRVTRTRLDADAGLVDLEIWSETAAGVTAHGTATVSLPRRRGDDGSRL